MKIGEKNSDRERKKEKNERNIGQKRGRNRTEKNIHIHQTRRESLNYSFSPSLFWFLHAFARDECHDLHNCYKTRSCQHSFTIFFSFNLATSSHISDELYYPNRQFLKQYISLATHGNSNVIMTPPAGDHFQPYVDTTFTSFQQTNSNNIDEWLSLDSNNGFIRLYDPNDTSTPTYSRSKLVPCSMRTTIEQICSRSNNELDSRTWYVQYHGDRLRHLRPDERPLFIQHDYLLSIGYSSVQRLQEEGDKHDLGYLIRFLSGKTKKTFLFFNLMSVVVKGRLVIDPKIQPRSLSTLAWIRKGKLIRKWIKRKCVISTSRLTVYPGLSLSIFSIEHHLSLSASRRCKYQSVCDRITTSKCRRSSFER